MIVYSDPDQDFEISNSHVKRGQTTWPIQQIKLVETKRLSDGEGVVLKALILIILIFFLAAAHRGGTIGGMVIFGALAAITAKGIHTSWLRTLTQGLWIQTRNRSDLVYSNIDRARVAEVRRVLEGEICNPNPTNQHDAPESEGTPL